MQLHIGKRCPVYPQPAFALLEGHRERFPARKLNRKGCFPWPGEQFVASVPTAELASLPVMASFCGDGGCFL